jgi:hypothetical protein
VSSRESLVEFPCVLTGEISGTGENQVTLADILDQPDHASGFPNLIGRWCSWCEIQAGSVPDSFVCLCSWIWIWIWIWTWIPITSLMGKRNTPRSGTHPRASFALLSRFYATLFLSLSICLSIPKKTLLVLLRPTVIVNIPRSESARTRLTSRLQLSRSGFRLGLLALNHTNRKRYSRPPKNRLF